MKRAGLKHKHFAAVAVIMSFMLPAVPIMAQQEELMAGRAAGEQAANASVSGTMWLAIGCVGGLVGLIVAYAFEPNPPATQLLGKTPEYVAAYTEAYKETSKKIQVSKAWVGCIASTIASIVLSVIVYKLNEDTGNDDDDDESYDPYDEYWWYY